MTKEKSAFEFQYHRVINAPRELIKEAIVHHPLASKVVMRDTQIEIVEIPTDTRPRFDKTGDIVSMIDNNKPGLSLKIKAKRFPLSETIQMMKTWNWCLQRKFEAEVLAGIRPIGNKDPNYFFPDSKSAPTQGFSEIDGI